MGLGGERGASSRSSRKADFFPLSNHFISQDNSILCGQVSSAIVLNALRLGKREGLARDRQSIAEAEMAWLPAGADPFYGKYVPNNVLSEHTKTRLKVPGKPILIEAPPESGFGLQLRPLAQMLRSHGLDVVTRVVDESVDAKAIRRTWPPETTSCWSTMRGRLWAGRAGPHLAARGVRRAERFLPGDGHESQPCAPGCGSGRPP